MFSSFISYSTDARCAVLCWGPFHGLMIVFRTDFTPATSFASVMFFQSSPCNDFCYQLPCRSATALLPFSHSWQILFGFFLPADFTQFPFRPPMFFVDPLMKHFLDSFLNSSSLNVWLFSPSKACHFPLYIFSWTVARFRSLRPFDHRFPRFPSVNYHPTKVSDSAKENSCWQFPCFKCPRVVFFSLELFSFFPFFFRLTFFSFLKTLFCLTFDPPVERQLSPYPILYLHFFLLSAFFFVALHICPQSVSNLFFATHGWSGNYFAYYGSPLRNRFCLRAMHPPRNRLKAGEVMLRSPGGPQLSHSFQGKLDSLSARNFH